MALKFSEQEIRDSFAKIRVAIVDGVDDIELSERLGISTSDTQELKRKFLEHEASLVRSKSTEIDYVEYCLEMQRSMADLDRLISSNKKIGSAISTVVSAVRARADIVDRMMKTGIDLGLIVRQGKNGTAEGGEAIKGLTNPEIRKYIFQEIQVFNNTMIRYGDRNITDLDIGPMYSLPPPQPVPRTPVKTSPHSRSPVSKGRRIVRD